MERHTRKEEGEIDREGERGGGQWPLWEGEFFWTIKDIIIIMTVDCFRKTEVRKRERKRKKERDRERKKG